MGNRKIKWQRKDKAAKRIPVLTETVDLSVPVEVHAGAGHQIVDPASPVDADQEIDPQVLEDLRSTLATQTIDLASQLLHGAVREMEAALLEQVLDRLREKLPMLIDEVLNQQLGTGKLPAEPN
jgi:hypothetical protein